MDENALEAMLARQRNAERGYRPQGSVRTEKTAEFEVYERKDAEDTLPEAPQLAPQHAPQRRAHAPLRAPAPRRDEGASDFEELPGRQAPPADPAPTPEAGQPAPQPSQPAWQPPAGAMPEELGTAPPAMAPESTSQDAPTAQAESVHEPAQETRRPQVWPPIQPRAPASPPSQPQPSAEASPPAAAEEPAAYASTPPQASQAPTPEEAAPAARSHAPGAAGHDGISNGNGCRIAIVQAMFNPEITQQMADAATAHAERTGAQVRHHVHVPGVFDLPLTVQTLARRKDVDAVVAIGCVIQGETDHDDLITFTTAKTLQEISLATETPVGLGIIGPGMTWEQARERIGNGAHAVDAVVAQWRLLQTV